MGASGALPPAGNVWEHQCPPLGHRCQSAHTVPLVPTRPRGRQGPQSVLSEERTALLSRAEAKGFSPRFAK